MITTISIQVSNNNFSAPLTTFCKKEPSKVATIAAEELSKPQLAANPSMNPVGVYRRVTPIVSLSPLKEASNVNYTEKLLEQVLVNETGMNFIDEFSNNRSIASLKSTGNEIAMLQLDGDYGVQTVEIWNISSQTKIRTFNPAHPDQGEAINCIAYGGEIDDEATSIVAVGTSKGNLELWNSINGKLMTAYPVSSTAPILEITSLKNGLLAIASGAEIIIYDCISKKEIDRFEASAPLTCFSYLGNNLIACGLKDPESSIKVYDFTTHECIFTAATAPGYFNRCIAPLSEKQFLAGNEMGGIYLFDLQDFTKKNVLGYVSPSTMVKISPTQIAAGFYGGLYIVNTQTWKYELASVDAGQPCGIRPSLNGLLTAASGYPISGETISNLALYILSFQAFGSNPLSAQKSSTRLHCNIRENWHLKMLRYLRAVI